MGNAPESALDNAVASSSSPGGSGSRHSHAAQPGPVRETHAHRNVHGSISSPQLRPPPPVDRTTSQTYHPSPVPTEMSASAPAPLNLNFPTSPEQLQRPPYPRRESSAATTTSYHASPTMGALMNPIQNTAASPLAMQGQVQSYPEMQGQATQLLSPTPQHQQHQQPTYPFNTSRPLPRSDRLMQPPSRPSAPPASGSLPFPPSPQGYHPHVRTSSMGGVAQTPTSSSSATSSGASRTPQQQHRSSISQANTLVGSSSFPPGGRGHVQFQQQMQMQSQSQSQQQQTPQMQVSPPSETQQMIPVSQQVTHSLRRVGPSFGPGQGLTQFRSPPSEYGNAGGQGMRLPSASSSQGYASPVLGGYTGANDGQGSGQNQQQQQHHQHQQQQQHQPPGQQTRYQQMQ